MLALESETERRKSKRKRVMLEVSYCQPGDLETDFVINLSEGGMFISTNEGFSVGQEISFHIQGRKLQEPLKLRGIVRWRQSAGPDGGAGIGVEFIFDDDSKEQSSEQLDRVLKKRRPAAT